jgi:hypothetical protein
MSARQILGNHLRPLPAPADDQGMAATTSISAGVDPKLTECYLLGRSDVLDASVWLSEGTLYAHVTTFDRGGIDSDTLRRACLEDLGIHQTPREVTLVAARVA